MSDTDTTTDTTTKTGCTHQVIKVTQVVDACIECGHETVKRPVVCADCGATVGVAVPGVREGTYTRSAERGSEHYDDPEPALPTIETGDEP